MAFEYKIEHNNHKRISILHWHLYKHIILQRSYNVRKKTNRRKIIDRAENETESRTNWSDELYTRGLFDKGQLFFSLKKENFIHKRYCGNLYLYESLN